MLCQVISGNLKFCQVMTGSVSLGAISSGINMLRLFTTG